MQNWFVRIVFDIVIALALIIYVVVASSYLKSPIWGILSLIPVGILCLVLVFLANRLLKPVRTWYKERNKLPPIDPIY